MKSLDEIQNDIIEDFSLFENNWEQKYEYIIDLGKEMPSLEPSLKTDDKLIRGCQSRVWLHSEFKNGIVNFTADSDAIITKGLVALLLKVLNNRSPEEIASANLHFISDTGLQQHLSPTRANGLLSMVKQMKYDALAYSTLNKN